MPISQLAGIHSPGFTRPRAGAGVARSTRAGYEHPSGDLSVLKFPNILCGSGEHQSMQARPGDLALGITWSWLAKMCDGSWQVLGALVIVVVSLFCAYCRFGRVRRVIASAGSRKTHRSHSKKDLGHREQLPVRSCLCAHCF